MVLGSTPTQALSLPAICVRNAGARSPFAALLPPAAALAACIGLPGCFTQPRPSITVVSAQIVRSTQITQTDTSAESADAPSFALVEVRFRGDNTTKHSLPLERVEYRVTDGELLGGVLPADSLFSNGFLSGFLGGVGPTPARRSPEMTLSPFRSAEFVVPIVVEGREIADGRLSLAASVLFRPPGILAGTLYDLGFYRPHVRLSETVPVVE